MSNEYEPGDRVEFELAGGYVLQGVVDDVVGDKVWVECPEGRYQINLETGSASRLGPW